MATKATKKKKRSQAPVALVYFTTLLVFMAVFGFIAYKLVDKMNVDKETESKDEAAVTDKHFSLLLARGTNDGKLGEAVVLYFAPDEDSLLIVPLTEKTVDPVKGMTLEQVYDEGGMKSLYTAVNETLDISVDHYIYVNNPSFESVCDILGGMTFVPKEELYMLGRDNTDDISYRQGRAVELEGKQIRQLLQAEKVFSGGEADVIDFYADALVQMATTAFDQATMTKNALDNIYNILISGGDTNYTKADFREHKGYLEEMLDRRIKPVAIKMPDGTWNSEDGKFTIDKTFKNELKEAIINVGGKISAQLKDDNSSSAQAIKPVQ